MQHGLYYWSSNTLTGNSSLLVLFIATAHGNSKYSHHEHLSFRNVAIKSEWRHLLIVKSIGTPSFDIILSWYLVAILLPAGWYVREIHGSESSAWSLESSGRSSPLRDGDLEPLAPPFISHDCKVFLLYARTEITCDIDGRSCTTASIWFKWTCKIKHKIDSTEHHTK